MCSFFKCIFACLLPPLAVLIDRGCNCDFCLNLLLTLFGYFPGCIHAYCIICGENPERQHYPNTVVTVVTSPAPPAPVIIDRLPTTLPYSYHPMQQQMAHQAGHPYIAPQMPPQSPQMMDQQMGMSGPPPNYFDSASAPSYQPYNDKHMTPNID